MTSMPPQPPQHGAPVPPQPSVPGQPQYGAPGQPQYGAPVPPQYGAPAASQYPTPGQPQYGVPVPPPYANPQPVQPAAPAYPAPPQQFGAAPGVAPSADFGPNPGYIVMTLQGNVMTSSMIVPQIRVDGWPVPSQYGQNLIPVAPGVHSVYVSAQWMREYGQASLPVEVRPGEHVQVFYRAPMHQFTTGSIGFIPQKAKGLAVFWAVMGVFGLMVVGMFAVAIGAALS